MEVSFYQISNERFVQSLVRLLEKIFQTGARCLFYSPSEERIRVLDKTLWTFSTNAFIPHGDASLGFADQQSVYLTNKIENPNKSEILLLADSFEYEQFPFDFKRLVFAFADSEREIQQASALFNHLKNKYECVHYWRQSQKGWEKGIG